jgi:hypothetical protein
VSTSFVPASEAAVAGAGILYAAFTPVTSLPPKFSSACNSWGFVSSTRQIPVQENKCKKKAQYRVFS